MSQAEYYEILERQRKLHGKPSITYSLLIGLGYFFAYVIFTPLTLMWLAGERHQGRIGIVLIEKDRELTWSFWVLIPAAVLHLFLDPIIFGVVTFK